MPIVSVPLTLTLISRRDCHLCEAMAMAIAAARGEVGFELSVRDVDADAELLARYSDQVPVLLVNGRKAFKYRVSAAVLVRRLRAEQRRDRRRGWFGWLPP